MSSQRPSVSRMHELRIATRRSRLALAQARWVAERLASAHPGLEIRLVEITTTGDTDRTTPVFELTEVGAFVRAVQRAVLEDRADVAVHSCKDLPVIGPESLRSAYPRREVPWDLLCGTTLAELPEGARVGTGSPRRSAQLLELRPDVEVRGIRGNVETRLGMVESGEVDAVVLAEAGLRRLGIDGGISQRFTLEQMVPAAGQAALAVEGVADSDAMRLVDAIADPETTEAVHAERTVLARTGAGCRAALGVLAHRIGGEMALVGFVHDQRGARRATARAENAVAAVESLVASLEVA